MKKVLEFIILSSLLACSTNSIEKPYQSTSCKSDQDCKGNRICNTLKGICENSSSSTNNEIIEYSQKDIIQQYVDTENELNYDAPSDIQNINNTKNDILINDIAKSDIQNCSPYSSKKCVENTIYWFDSCNKMSEKVNDCKTNEYCVDAICKTKEPTCIDDCSPIGLKICDGQGYKTCGNYDSDSCLEWSIINNCGNKEFCKEGTCTPCGYDYTFICSGNDVYAKDICNQIDLIQSCESKYYKESCIEGCCVSSLCTYDGEELCIKEGDKSATIIKCEISMSAVKYCINKLIIGDILNDCPSGKCLNKNECAP